MEEKNEHHSAALNALDGYRQLIPTKDRRLSCRVALSFPMEVCGESPFNAQPVKVNAANFSAKGVYFVSPEAYLAGQLLYVTVKLPGDPPRGSSDVFLTVRCRIQRVEPLSVQGAKRFGVAVSLDE